MLGPALHLVHSLDLSARSFRSFFARAGRLGAPGGPPAGLGSRRGPASAAGAWRRFTGVAGVSLPLLTSLLFPTLALLWPAPAQADSHIARHNISNIRYELLRSGSTSLRAGSSFEATLDREGQYLYHTDNSPGRPRQTVAIRGGEKPGGGRYKVGYDYETCTDDCVAVISIREGHTIDVWRNRSTDRTWAGWTGRLAGYALRSTTIGIGIRFTPHIVTVRVARNAPQGATFQVGFSNLEGRPRHWRGFVTTFTVSGYERSTPQVNNAWANGSLVGVGFTGGTLQPDGPGKPGPYGPPASAFTVKVNGEEATVNSLDITGRSVRLGLAQAVKHTDEVRVS